MSGSASYRRFISLAARFGGSDAALAGLLDISRTTLWRIRKQHIQKLDRYIQVLEKHLGDTRPDPMARVLDDLRLWSADSTEVRDVLFSLHRMLQDPATP